MNNNVFFFRSKFRSNLELEPKKKIKEDVNDDALDDTDVGG